MKNSLIEWCHHTVNFWWGCTFARLLDGSVRQECVNCYALKLSKFFSHGKATWGEKGLRWIRHEAARRELYKLDKAAFKRGVRERIFVNSMSDTFEDRRDLDEAREMLWGACQFVSNLDMLLLTKRPENVLRMVPKEWLTNWPAHVCIGTTAGTQAAADQALPVLCQLPAKIIFVSMEPLLEGVDLTAIKIGTKHLGGGRTEPVTFNALKQNYIFGDEGDLELRAINWVIVGGESGPKARMMKPAWAQSLRDQCKAAGVPFFFKQWGEWFPGFSDDGFFFDDRHGMPEKFPTEFPVDEFPAEDDGTYQEMARIGKKNTGRILDGVEHSEFPVTKS